MPVLVLILIAIAAWWHFFESPGAFRRPFDKETKLGIFEHRISSASDELFRRSPALKANWQEFKLCAKTRGCDSKSIRAERDKLVAEAWPDVFDRLVVKNDWGAMSGSRNYHEEFLTQVKKFGVAHMRDKCVPKLEYWYVQNFDYNISDFCPDNGAGNSPRR